MTGRLAHIFRHPIKGIGSESCETIRLRPESGVEGDRAWALLNEAAEDTDDWQPRRNFLHVASGPPLAAIRATTTKNGILLSHPDRDPKEIKPDTDGAVLTNWIGDLWPAERPSPARLVKAPPQGMTDVPFASVSIGNLSSLKCLSRKVGFDVDMRRFRINLWLDGLAPWEEIDLLKGDLRLGSATLSPVEPIESCRAPDANPVSGQRDIGMLGLLSDEWDTRDFGVYFKVSQAGEVAIGATIG